MRRRRWLRRVALAMAALVVLASAARWFLWRPVAPAARFFARLTAANPTEAEFKSAGGDWELFEGHDDGEARVYPPPACCVIEGSSSDAPLVIVVAGVTPKGIGDPRVLRLVLALHDAGFAVVAPDIRGLAHPGEDERQRVVLTADFSGLVPAGRDAELVELLVYAWERFRGHRRRVAFLGVSLGGGLVLRALTRGLASDPAPSTVSSVCLVGAPDDVPALAREWFRRPARATGGDPLARQRASDGCFARHGVLRSAIPSLVPDAADRKALRAWLDSIGEALASEVAEPTGLSSFEARRWLAAARAEGSIGDADREWILTAATPFLASTSPSAIPAAGLARLTMPVFLIHGEADPLIPATEMSKLAARLGKAGTVRTLSSQLLSHVEVESPGIAEAWRHLRFVQDFFDVAGRPP